MDTPDLCADVIAHCECVRPEGHDEPHVCSCNGSWNADGSIVAFPEGRTLEQAAEAFVDLLYFPMTSRFGGLSRFDGLFYQGDDDS